MRSTIICSRTLVSFIIALVALVREPAPAQSNVEKEHRRGKLWENLSNDGWVGTAGAWDFLVSVPEGMYPGFDGYVHPVGNEFAAENTYANANMHNFRSGSWIVVKDMIIPGGPPIYDPYPVPYEIYASGMQEDAYGVANNLEPLALIQNFIGSPGFDERLPEEMTDGFWYTNTGIRVTRRSYVWSYPGFRDFIIYDYVFKHTGEFVSTLTGVLVPNLDPSITTQTLNDVYIVFHSGISVSTKSPINFHCELAGVHAGAFGWKPEQYHDYYHIEDGGELVYSSNYDGGKNPHPNSTIYCIKANEAWKDRFGEEMFSPAAFGWLALYAEPLTGQPARSTPRPDILRVDSHKGGSFRNRELDFEAFDKVRTAASKDQFHIFAMTPDTQAALGNNGDRLNFYTLSYGPYTLAPGDSVRFVLAEIAGVMDYKEVNAGDPNGYFPDSTKTAIRRNAANARKAFQWGFGAMVDGTPIAADAPEPPPAPVTVARNISEGLHKPIVGVSWDKVAEITALTDGMGNTFYGGLADLQGYRVYRSSDFQFTSETEPPVFRGAAWDLVADIPKAAFSTYLDATTDTYEYSDSTAVFGFRYAYFVSPYWTPSGSWVSVNGTVVSGLPELAAGDYNQSAPTAAAPGPSVSMDVFTVPNPYVYNDAARSFGRTDPYKIEFRNLPERCTIRIYTLMGDLVRVVEHSPDAQGNLYGSTGWDQKSTSGVLVAPGLYIYNVESKTSGVPGSFTGKLMIVR